MATRSRIAVANPGGTFTSIYCHWDGYPSGVGATLRDHYTDAAKTHRLLALGNLSVLDREIGEKHDFEEAPEGETTAYARDRGDEGGRPDISQSFEALCELTRESGGEYLYVFKGGQWFCAKGGIAFFGQPASRAPEFLESIDEVLRQSAQTDI